MIQALLGKSRKLLMYKHMIAHMKKEGLFMHLCSDRPSFCTLKEATERAMCIHVLEKDSIVFLLKILI